MLTQGTTLQERYRIIQHISDGGMGAVYTAYDLRFHNLTVAVKENLSGQREQFQIEANLLAKLRHANLPRVTDYFSERGAQFIVMDYVEGRDLASIVRQSGALDVGVALNWLKDIFEAVHYLHTARVIHRDIKPQNIIITPTDRAVLVDLGIAKATHSDWSIRAATSGFTPPEQYVGGTTERSDLYALGATIYYAVTGRVPTDALERQLKRVVVPTPRQLNKAIPSHVENAVLKAIQLDPDQRHSSVTAMMHALYRPPPRVETIERHFDYKKITPHTARNAVVIDRITGAGRVVMSGNLAWSPDGQTLAAAGDGLPLYQLASMTRPTLVIPGQQVSTVDFSPDGKLIACVVDTKAGGFQRVAPVGQVWKLGDSGGQLLHTYDGYAADIRFSPVGRLIAVSKWNGDPSDSLWPGRTSLYRLDSGEQVYQTYFGIGLSFHPQGRLLALNEPMGPVYLWEVGSDQQPSLLPGQKDSRAVAFSSNGRWLAIGDLGGQVQIRKGTDGGLVRVLKGHNGPVNCVAFSPTGEILASGSADRSIRLWRVRDGSLIHLLSGHEATVCDVAFCPDSRKLASRSVDGTILLWGIR